jgi:hypothetical protein
MIPSLAELIPWNRLLGCLNVYKYGLRVEGPGHGGTWSNRTYVALALFSLLATCVVF